MKRILFVLLSGLIMLTGCDDGFPTATSSHDKPVRVAPWLYEITFDQYDTRAIENYYRSTSTLYLGGGCSVVRNGDFVGRNLDFYYVDMAEFVLRVPAAPGRYASIGVASCMLDITDRVAQEETDSPLFDLLPYLTVDGINECGVYCSINMVPHDCGTTLGTRPGAPSLFSSMLVRWVLDNCATAREARERLAEMNLVCSRVLGEAHFFIADGQESLVVETIDNQYRCEPVPENIMTNFHLLTDTLTLHSAGLERYDILREHYAEGATLDGMSNLMQRVRYSQAYDLSMSPLWLSEEYGYKYHGVTLGLDTPDSLAIALMEIDAEKFEKRNRSFMQMLWFTSHTSVYDLQHRTLRIYAQEDYTQHYDYSL